VNPPALGEPRDDQQPPFADFADAAVTRVADEPVALIGAETQRSVMTARQARPAALAARRRHAGGGRPPRGRDVVDSVAQDAHHRQPVLVREHLSLRPELRPAQRRATT
jgi:hypothetical protein